MSLCDKPGLPSLDEIEPQSIRPMEALVLLIDSWIATHPDPKPSRPEALRHVLRDEMVRNGMLNLYKLNADD